MSASSTTRRRLGAAAVTALACAATAMIPSAASAATPAAGNARSAPAVSKEALAAGRAQFGAGATADQALSAYWTPERMRSAKPVEASAAYQQAVEHGAAPQEAQTT